MTTYALCLLNTFYCWITAINELVLKITSLPQVHAEIFFNLFCDLFYGLKLVATINFFLSQIAP